jgi:hypothetical protein
MTSSLRRTSYVVLAKPVSKLETLIQPRVSCLLQGNWNYCTWIYLAPQHIEALVEIAIVLLLWMISQDIHEFSFLVTNQIYSPYSRALLKEPKMNLISKSRRLEVTMAPSSRILQLKIIMIKRESNMNFQPSTPWSKMELVKGRIRLLLIWQDQYFRNIMSQIVFGPKQSTPLVMLQIDYIVISC